MDDGHVLVASSAGGQCKVGATSSWSRLATGRQTLIDFFGSSLPFG